jgi:hypothetical protein
MANYGGRWFYELGSIIARARGVNGDPEPDMARALLAYFSHCIEADTVPDARVMHYLASAFREFLDQGENNDLQKTLGLKRRRAGNPGGKARKQKRSVRLTPDALIELRQEVVQRLRNDEKHADIKVELSELFATSQDTVRRIIREMTRIASVAELNN